MTPKCEACTEPTKRPTGFWDGRDKHGHATHGLTYTCESETCPDAQARREREADADERRAEAHFVNEVNGVDVRELRRLRLEANCTMMDVSRILKIMPSTYSRYETEREAIPPRHWELLMSYLKEV